MTSWPPPDNKKWRLRFNSYVVMCHVETDQLPHWFYLLSFVVVVCLLFNFLWNSYIGKRSSTEKIPSPRMSVNKSVGVFWMNDSGMCAQSIVWGVGVRLEQAAFCCLRKTIKHKEQASKQHSFMITTPVPAWSSCPAFLLNWSRLCKFYCEINLFPKLYLVIVFITAIETLRLSGVQKIYLDN